MKDTTTPALRTLDLPAGSATSVEATPGSIVRAQKGTVWLTQAGLPYDFVLVPGMRFVSASRGKIVLTPLEGAAVARVYVAACGEHASAPSGLQFDSGFLDRQERIARRARLREFGRRIDRLRDSFATALRRLRHPAPQH